MVADLLHFHDFYYSCHDHRLTSSRMRHVTCEIFTLDEKELQTLIEKELFELLSLFLSSDTSDLFILNVFMGFGFLIMMSFPTMFGSSLVKPSTLDEEELLIEEELVVFSLLNSLSLNSLHK